MIAWYGIYANLVRILQLLSALVSQQDTNCLSSYREAVSNNTNIFNKHSDKGQLAIYKMVIMEGSSSVRNYGTLGISGRDYKQ